MSAQPANTEISIFRTARSMRQILRHESVKAIIGRLRPLIMVVPGDEILVGVLTRDTANKDFSPYCGQAAAGALRGFPIVVGLEPVMSFSQAETTVPNGDFPFVIGSDWFIQNTEAGLTDDLYGELRNMDPGYGGGGFAGDA